MKAIVLPQYNNNVLRAMLSLKTEEVSLPLPEDNEVVVEMHAATCNPSDIAFIRGIYNVVKPIPAIPGFEASGSVIKTGANTVNLLGKRVSCFVQSNKSGTWAEQFIVHKDDIIVLGDDMDMDQAAAFSVNPFTAYGLIQIASQRESEAIIQNASGGQVASFVRKLAELNNIKVIDIVRKPETAAILKQENQFTLCESDEDFFDQLKELAHTLNATTAFDAVGSTLSGQMFNAMPPDAELVVYGGLSGKRMTDINEMDIIFQNKLISGFNLLDWKNELDEEEFETIAGKMESMFTKSILKTRFQGMTSLDEIKGGLKAYIGNMSGGKLLIKPST